MITLAEIKAYYNITTNQYDTQITQLILKYESFIQNYCWIIKAKEITENLTFQNVFVDSFWVKFWLNNNVLEVKEIWWVIVATWEVYIDWNKVIYTKDIDLNKPFLTIKYQAWYTEYEDIKQIILSEIWLELSNMPTIWTTTTTTNNWIKSYKEWPLEIQYFSNNEKYWQRLENDFISNYKNILSKYKIITYRNGL